MTARLNPDPHHDGLIVSSAMATKQGLIPYLNFSSQYGPIVSWFNSILLIFPGYELLTLRITYFMICLCIFYLIHSRIKLFRESSISYLALIFWISSNPVWITTKQNYFNYWPWPDLLNTLIMSLIFVLIFHWKKIKYSVLIGILFALQFYIKPLFGITEMGLIFLILLIYLKNKRRLDLKALTPAIVSWFITNISILLLISYYSSIHNFISDYILFPFQFYSKSFEEFISIVFKMSLNSYTVILLLIILLYQFNNSGKYLNLQKRVFFASLLLITFLAISLPQELSPDYFTGKLLPLHISVIFVLILTLALAYKYTFTKESFSFTKLEIILLLFSTSSLLNVIYIGDVYHLWLSAPFILVTGLHFISKLRVNPFIKFWIISIITINLISGLINLTHERYELKVSPLKGMLASEIQVRAYDQISELYLSLDSKRVDFSCADGLFFVINGRYMPTNYNPLTWGNRLNDFSGNLLISCSREISLIPPEFLNEFRVASELPTFGQIEWSHWSTSKLFLLERN